MLRTQSSACVAEWHYSSLKAIHDNNNIYFILIVHVRNFRLNVLYSDVTWKEFNLYTNFSISVH